LRELRALRKHPKLVKLSEATPRNMYCGDGIEVHIIQLGCQSQCEQIVGACEEVCLS